MPVKKYFLPFVMGCLLMGCGEPSENKNAMEASAMQKGQYGYDSHFLLKHGKGVF